MPYRMDEIYHALARADLFVSIGTSGAVYPAAGFVREARAGGARTLELNLEPSEGGYWFDETRHGQPTALVPPCADRLDWQSVVSGHRVSVRVDLRVRCILHINTFFVNLHTTYIIS